MQAGRRSHTRSARSHAAARVCAVALASLLIAPAVAAGAHPPKAPQPYSAALEQCVTSVVQSERSAEFVGEMTAVPGTVRMAMRIEVQAQAKDVAGFRLVNASPWRFSGPKIKVNKFVKDVSNLSSPEVYRALVRFRWLGARGHVIKHAQLLTAPCVQPAAPALPAA